VKGVLGWVMHNVLRLSKHIDKVNPRYPGDVRYRFGSYAVGLTPEELEDNINGVYRTF